MAAFPGQIALSAFVLMPMPRQKVARPFKRSAPASNSVAFIRASACFESGGSSITQNHSTMSATDREAGCGRHRAELELDSAQSHPGKRGAILCFAMTRTFSTS